MHACKRLTTEKCVQWKITGGANARGGNHLPLGNILKKLLTNVSNLTLLRRHFVMLTSSWVVVNTVGVIDRVVIEWVWLRGCQYSECDWEVVDTTGVILWVWIQWVWYRRNKYNTCHWKCVNTVTGIERVGIQVVWLGGCKYNGWDWGCVNTAGVIERG